MSGNKYMEVVLGRVDELNIIVHHKLKNREQAKNVNARLSEALTFAMQLGLMESTKAGEIAAKANAHICKLYNLSHISSL